MPDKETVFYILHHQAIDKINLKNKQNETELIQELKEAEKHIGEAKTSTSDELISKLFANSEETENNFLKSHQAWLEKTNTHDNQFIKEEMLKYIWDNQPNDNDPLSSNFWYLINRIFTLYKRLERKGINCEYSVVGTMKYPSTPFSEEGFLPIFKIEQGDNSIFIIATDPVANSYTLLVSSRIKIDLTNCAAINNRKEYYEKMFSWLPDNITTIYASTINKGNAFNITITDDYDLYSATITLFKKNSEPMFF
jgi:hypothetical protein